jgi:8-oxo-dGTP diphosphatase
MRICAGGLLVRGNTILLAKRSADRAFYPGVWDVVGGHCEENETPADALIRELEEEIGVRAAAFEKIATLEEPQPAEHGEAHYHIFAVTSWTGEPRLLNTEHSELRWLSLAQALVLPLAHPRYGQLFRAMLEGRESVRPKETRYA